MAILNSLICNGPSRFLNKIYCGDIDVNGTAGFSSLSASSITSTGTLSATGAATFGSTVTATGDITTSGAVKTGISGLYIDNRQAVFTGSSDTWLRINSNKTFTGGVYFGSSTVRTDSFLQVGGNGQYFQASTSGVTTTKLKTADIEATNSITSPKWEIDSIANLGGTFMVAPTIYFSNEATITTGTITSTTMPITITDTSTNNPFNGITSENKLAGTTWFQGAKVKFSGTINGVGFSSAEGIVSSQMTTSNKRIQLNITTSKAYNVLTSNTAYTGNQINNIVVMQYQTPTSNNGNVLNPLGIYMCSFGDNRKSYIDIYGGTSSGDPDVRIGLLTGMAAIGGQTPAGWGIAVKSGSGYFGGTLCAPSGTIGGWTIGTSTLTNGTLGQDNSMCLRTSDLDNAGAVSIGGSPATITNWRIGAGSKFGVTSDGTLYASNAIIAGDITANSLTIGNNVSIPQSNIANLTSDLGNKASASDVTALSNKINAVYGTCSTSAGTRDKVVTCSNFELFTGALITVKFSNSNSYADTTNNYGPRLNVNSKGVKDIYVAGAISNSTTNRLVWGSNAEITFRYNGTAFVVIGDPKSWSGKCTTAAATATKNDTVNSSYTVPGCVICKGTVVSLLMSYGNTATAPMLSIGGAPAYALYASNDTSSNYGVRPLVSNGYSWADNTVETFVFDGQYWRIADTANLNKALDAAKTATSYITYVDATNGIKVHNSDDQTDYIQVNSTAVSMYRNSNKMMELDDSSLKFYNNNDTTNAIAQFGTDILLGKTNSTNRNIYIDTDSGINIRSGTTNLAIFGTDITLGQTSGTNRNIFIDADSGVSIKKGSTILANFGDTITINHGTSAKKALTLDSTNGLKFYKLDGSTLAAQLNADGLTVDVGIIGGWNITDAQIDKSYLDSTNDKEYRVIMNSAVSTVSGSYGFCVATRDNDGNGTTGDWSYPFGVKYDGSLIATKANISGTVTATNGTIGGWTISEHSLSATTDSNTTYLMDGSNTNHDVLVVQTDTNGTLAWPFWVRADGSMHAEKGTIGGWTIGTNSLYKNTNSISSTTAGTYVGTDGIRSYYDSDHNVTISWGKIEATWAQIGNFTIYNDSIWADQTNTTNTSFFIQKKLDSNGSNKLYCSHNWDCFSTTATANSGNPFLLRAVSSGTYTYYGELDLQNANASTTINLNGSNGRITCSGPSNGEAQVNVSVTSGRSGRLYANAQSFGLYDVGNSLMVIYSASDQGVHVPHVFYSYGWDGNVERAPIGSTPDNTYRVGYMASNSTSLSIRAQWGGSTFSGRSISVPSSDIRLKTNISSTEVEDALSTINAINIRSFDWKNDRGHQKIGFIADEMEKIDPKFATGGGYDDDGAMNVKSVDTFYLQGYEVKAIQELHKLVKQQEDKINKLEKEIKELKGLK